MVLTAQEYFTITPDIYVLLLNTWKYYVPFGKVDLVILEVTIVVYPCLLMLKCEKKRMPGTAGRKLDFRSNPWDPHF